jgi:DNA-binding transcriptional LysR family regulator
MTAAPALPHPARLDRIDLNLFRVLDAIHSQGGISGAARVLHLSQPAVSHALRRLREALGDALFVRHGNRMLPTEFTRRVIGEVQAHLRGLQGVLHSAEAFDPARLQIGFRIGLRDVMESITLPALMAHLVAQAPGVSLASRRVPREALERELLAGELDVAIERQTRMGPRVHGLKLADEPLAVVCAAGQRPGAQRISLRRYLDTPHVLVSMASEADPMEPLLALSGHSRRVALRCQHYFAAAQVVAGTGWLLTMPRTYARELARVLPVAVSPLPLPVPPLAIWMYWPADRDADPAHRWLRGLLQDGARQVMGRSGRPGHAARE